MEQTSEELYLYLPTKQKILQAVLMTYGVWAIMACSTWNSSGYEALSTLERNKVVECQDGIGNLHNDGHVYLITTGQLQEYLDTAGRVVIYEYLFYCKSEHCVNPLTVEQDCKNQGARFLLMIENYEGIIGLPPLKSPILAVNPAPFGKKISQTCTPQFFNRLTSTTYKTRGYGRYYLFDNGKFKGCFNNYKDALSTDKSSLPEHSPNVFLVMYDAEIGKEPLLKAIKEYKVEIIYDYNIINGMALKKPESKTLEETMQYFKTVKGVTHVEYDHVYHLTDPVKPKIEIK